MSLGGCGGGNGSGNGPAGTTTTLTGVAAKGLLIGATVNVYCGNASGSTLFSGATGAAGDYSANWTTACSQPLLISIATNSTTTMISDITGLSSPAPLNFTLRAYAANSSTTVSQNVTPFTDMAAALTDTLSGSGVPTAAQVASAVTAIVNTVLNGQQGVFDATPLAPGAVTSSTSTSAQTLSALLTALMEQANAVGGIKNLMQNLNAQITQEVTISSAGAITFNSNVGTPANDPVALIQAGLTLASHDPGVTNAIIKTLVGNTSLVGNNCATTGCVVAVAINPITAATALLNALRTELAADFSTLGSNSNNSGFLQTQFAAIQRDASTITNVSSLYFESRSSVQATLDMVQLLNTINDISTAGALPTSYRYDSTGTVLNVSTTNTFRNPTQPFNNTKDPFTGNAATIYVSHKLGYLCFVASDALNAMWCNINTTRNGNYNLAEYSSSNTSGYQTYTVRVVAAAFPTAGQSGNSTLTWSNLMWETAMPSTIPTGGTMPVGMTGTGTFTLDANNNIPSASLNGYVFPMLASADVTSINANFTSTPTSTGKTQTAAGTTVTTSNGTPVLTMTVANGSTATRDTNGNLLTFNVGVNASTTLFQYAGNLTATAAGLDASGTKHGISQALFNLSASTVGASNPFFTGSLSAATSNWSTYNATLPISTTNYPQVTAALAGSIVDGSSAATITTSATAVGGTYGKDVSLTIAYHKNGNPVIAGTGKVVIDNLDHIAAGTNAQFTNGPAAINLTYNGSAISGNVTANTKVIGVINVGTNQIDFSDGSFISLY